MSPNLARRQICSIEYVTGVLRQQKRQRRRRAWICSMLRHSAGLSYTFQSRNKKGSQLLSRVSNMSNLAPTALSLTLVPTPIGPQAGLSSFCAACGVGGCATNSTCRTVYLRATQGSRILEQKGLGKEEAPEPFHAHRHPHLSGVTIAEKPPHNCIKFSRVNEWLFQSEESAVYT